MHQILNDPIHVTVDFLGSRVRPRKIKWGQNTYTVETVNLIHSSQEGSKRLFYFSVSNKENFMKLRFDPMTMNWRLVEIYTE